MSRGETDGRYGAVVLKEVEIAYDFYPNTADDAEGIKHFIDKHFFLRRSRADSYNTKYSTNYIGRKGNIRDGAKGTRCYVKIEHGKTFCRFEMQFNRTYLKAHAITYYSLPIDPLSFQCFDFVEILDDFSEKGVRNISRSILKKQGITSALPDYQLQLSKMVRTVRSDVLGGTRGPRKKVPTQIKELSHLNKQHGMAVDFKRYFAYLLQEKQLITCLADVGYPEDNCSKRLMFCQGTEK